MTLFNPYMMLGRNTIYASTVHNNDISTAGHLAALNAAMTQCQTFVFDRGYNLTSRAISGTSNLFVVPAGLNVIADPNRPLDMSMMANSGTPKYLVRADGTAGTAQNLGADLAAGSETVTLDADKIAALALVRGDRVTLVSDRLFVAGSTVGAEEQGEISTVVAVGATTITISPPAQDAYAVSDGARVAKLAMAKGIRIEGLRGIGPGQFATDTVGDRMLHMIWADGLHMDGCGSDYLDNGSYLYSCPDLRVTGWRAVFQPQNARTANQYGLAFVNACQDGLIEDSTGAGGKHFIVQTESSTARGVTRRMTVRDCTATGTWNYALATHTNAEEVTFERNQINGCNAGIDAGSRGVTTRDNVVRFLPDANIGVGISVSEVPEDFTSSGDRVFGGRYGIRCDSTFTPPLSGSTGPSGIRVRDFYAERFSQRGVLVKTTAAGKTDIDLRGIHTREAGGATGGVTAAVSVEVAGDFTNVVIADCNLQAAAGNASACLVTQGITNGRVRNIDYAGHAAPSAGGADVTQTNVSAF